MSGDAQLMLMIAGMHLLGLVCAVVLLLPALRDSPAPPPNSDGGSDGGGGRGPSPALPSSGPGGGLPLPDGAPARVRLRDHRRLGDLQPPRHRRPAREPQREPVHAAR